MRWRSFPTWLLLCVPVLVGTAIMLCWQAPLARWGIHLAACVFGVMAHLITTRVPWRLTSRVAFVAAVATASVIASTLAAPGIDGVRRWYEVGPLLVHASALCTPVLLVFAASEQARRPFGAHAMLLAVQVVHCLQPDAGQATGLGLGAAALAAASLQGRQRVFWMGSSLLAAVLAWLRHDPLPPVPFVEDIVARAFALAPVVGAVALVSLGLLVVAPLAEPSSSAAARVAGFALAAYFAGSLVASCFGEFPVPLLGFGSSPLVGAFLGLAAIRRMKRDPAGVRPTEASVRRGAEDGGFTSRCSRLHDRSWIRRSALRHVPCPSPIR